MSLCVSQNCLVYICLVSCFFFPCCCAVRLLPDYYFCSLCICLSPDYSFSLSFSFSFSVIPLFSCGARSCWSDSIGIGWLCEGCSCWACSGSPRGGSWGQAIRWEVDREDQNHTWFATREHFAANGAQHLCGVILPWEVLAGHCPILAIY